MSSKAEDEKTRRNFRLQRYYEGLGAQAFIEGLNQDENPYPLNSVRWNHWIFGWQNARGEKTILDAAKAGKKLQFFATTGCDPIFELSVEEAKRKGLWKPRYYLDDDA